MPNEGQKNVGKKKVLPGLEPGLQGSEPWVLTNYTIEPSSSCPPNSTELQLTPPLRLGEDGRLNKHMAGGEGGEG